MGRRKLAKIGHKPTNFKWLRFEKTIQGCDLCISHKVNQDGYIRKRWTENVCEMLHRFLYRATYNMEEIPAGHTIHHLCGNRNCCNVTHMILMKHGDHARHHNYYRDFKIDEWNKELFKDG